MIEEKLVKRKREGRPPPKWMRRVADYNAKEDTIVDYNFIASEFGTTIRSARSLCNRLRLKTHRVPNPKGGTFKKFSLFSFLRAVKDHVCSYKYL